VTLASGTAGAAIYYTLDGTDPAAGGIHYTGPITVGMGKTLKAVAKKAGLLDSPVLSEVYTQLYRITYNLNDGAWSGGEPVTEYAAGTRVTLEQDIVHSGGYRFGGWYETSNFSGSAVTEVSLDGDKTYYARWEGNAGVSLSPSAASFTNGAYDYDQTWVTNNAVITVTVTNTGDIPTGELAVALTEPHADSFIINGGNAGVPGTVASIAVSGADSFTVRPAVGLAVGTYTAALTVSNSDNSVSAQLGLNFTVTKVLTRIDITTPPTRTDYGLGETIDIAGLVVKATFSDMSTQEPYPVTAANLNHTAAPGSVQTGFDVTVTVAARPILLTSTCFPWFPRAAPVFIPGTMIWTPPLPSPPR
jgi:uncharacterized repeat protein (TIGR02543 family)